MVKMWSDREKKKLKRFLVPRLLGSLLVVLKISVGCLICGETGSRGDDDDDCFYYFKQ